MTVLDQIAFALICYSALPATLFVVVYARRPWWRSIYGRALMLSGLSLALLLDLTLLFRWVPVPGAHVIQLVVFALVAVATTLMCVAVVKAGRSR